MSYKISVIIPIYNGFKSLKEAIDSVINQSIDFKNIELLLIDDNSKDNSKEIIENYMKQYSNIKGYFLKESHGGPAYPRNIGLKNASAPYIMFLDDDDTYDLDMCKTLYQAIQDDNADIVCCNRISIDFIGEKKAILDFPDKEKENGKIIFFDDEILLFNNILIWNKIFKKEIIDENNIKFNTESLKTDDFRFSIEYFLKSKKLVVLPDYYGYNWNIHQNSLSNTVNKQWFDDVFDSFYYIYKLLKENNKDYIANILFGPTLSHVIGQCTYLNSSIAIENVLKEINAFENLVNNEFKFREHWIQFINTLILKKQYKLAIALLKLIRNMRNNSYLRKINRKLN